MTSFGRSAGKECKKDASVSPTGEQQSVAAAAIAPKMRPFRALRQWLARLPSKPAPSCCIPDDFSQRFGAFGDQIAESLRMFSFDLVGVIAAYGQELQRGAKARVVNARQFPPHIRCGIVSEKNELWTQSSGSNCTEVYAADGTRIRSLKARPNFYNCTFEKLSGDLIYTDEHEDSHIDHQVQPVIDFQVLEVGHYDLLRVGDNGKIKARCCLPGEHVNSMTTCKTGVYVMTETMEGYNEVSTIGYVSFETFAYRALRTWHAELGAAAISFCVSPLEHELYVLFVSFNPNSIFTNRCWRLDAFDLKDGCKPLRSMSLQSVFKYGVHGDIRQTPRIAGCDAHGNLVINNDYQVSVISPFSKDRKGRSQFEHITTFRHSTFCSRYQLRVCVDENNTMHAAQWPYDTTKGLMVTSFTFDK